MTPFELGEYIKCAKDPIYFLNTYGYIYNVKTKQVDRLTCFDYQEDLVNKIKDFQNNVVLKSRQMGISVISAGYVVWTLLFKLDQRILIVANDGAGAVRFLDTVKQFLQFLPPFLYDSKKDDIINNQKFLSIKSGNWVKAVASGKQAGRGEALTLLILDETAFIENAEEIWMGAGIALTATKGKCVMISTPNGTGNLYHKTWVGAEKGEGNFVPTKIHWTQHPIYNVGTELKRDEHGREFWTSPWYEEECDRMNQDKIKIAQELDLSFEGSRALVIDSHIIIKYKKSILNDVPVCHFDYLKPLEEAFVDIKTNFTVYKKPVQGKNYIIGADVGRGDGSDFSTIQIIDADDLEQVAEYQGKVPPDLFASIIKQAATAYNMAYVVIECNSFGYATSLALKNQLQYDSNRIYHSKSLKKLVNHHFGISVDENGEIPGFQTTQTTRPLVISSIGAYMREGKIILHSHKLLNEFDTFIYNGIKPEHAVGYHDDLIFALGIALFIRDTQYQNVFLSKEYFTAMNNAFTHVQKDNTSLYQEDTKTEKMNVPTNTGDDDLSWLLGSTT